jgi:hypothetical protein
MRTILGAFCILALLAAVVPAQATMTFSNVFVGGSLSGGATTVTGPDFIQFFTPGALVGDPVDPLRVGNVIATFDAASTSPIDKDSLAISSTGLSGSGMIYFNEVVEDLTDPNNIQTIATFNATLTAATVFPFNADINFSTPSEKFRVKKTFVLAAPPTAELDIAAMTSVSQTFTPEPATLVGLVLGVLGMLRRR